MKTIVKLILTGSALTAAGAASAATITNLVSATGGSDLVLFVTDTTTGAAFVQDLNVNVASLGVTPTSVATDQTAGNLYNVENLGTVGPLSNPVGANGVDSTLASFLTSANTGGNAFVYGILGANDVGGGIGQLQAVFTMTGAPSTVQGGVTNSSNMYLADPYTSDVNASVTNTEALFQAVNSANGAVYAKTSGTGLFGASSVGVPNDAALGTSVYLYELASLGVNAANVYGSAVAISISATGVISGFAAGAPAVPLPASVWLLGSGLIGLLGIGRRRLSASAGKLAFGGFAF